MKIKVCYTTHESNLTGASQSLLDLLDGLDRNDVHPVVLLRKKGPLEQELKTRNIDYKIVFYAQTIKRAGKRDLLKSSIKKIVNIIQEHRIARLLQNEKIQIVHNNSILAISGMNAARGAKIPYICHIREVLFGNHSLRSLDINELKKCIDNAENIIAISQYVKDQYESIIKDNNCTVIYDGIKIEKYYTKHRILFTDKKVRILLAGRIEEGKRQLDAIKAIKMLNEKKTVDCELYVAGNDAPNSEYPSKVKDYLQRNSVTNAFLLGFQDLHRLREKCDICLMCSSNEALGRVIVEGMLSGCLLIGADACATPEIIKDGENGYLYKSRDAASLSMCIERVLEDKQEARIIAETGQKNALSFNVKDYSKRIEAIYKGIIYHNRYEDDQKEKTIK